VERLNASLREQFLCGVNRGAGKGTVRESEMRDMVKGEGSEGETRSPCKVSTVLPENGSITSPSNKAENPVFKSVDEALYSLSESNEEVSMTGSGTGHIPGHVAGWGLV